MVNILRATKYYSAQIEEALERIKTPAFYNVFVTLSGQDIFQLTTSFMTVKRVQLWVFTSLWILN